MLSWTLAAVQPGGNTAHVMSQKGHRQSLAQSGTHQQDQRCFGHIAQAIGQAELQHAHAHQLSRRTCCYYDGGTPAPSGGLPQFVFSCHLAELLMHGISREVHIQHDAGDSTAQPSVTKMRTPAHAAP